MISVTRKGDMSSVTYIEFCSSEEGISVCVHPDESKSPTRESIRICGLRGGMRSFHVYQALALIEKELGTPQESSILKGDDGRIIFMRGRGDSDFTLKTDNLISSGNNQFYGAKVFFRKTNPKYALVVHLMKAVEEDNQVRPIP